MSGGPEGSIAAALAGLRAPVHPDAAERLAEYGRLLLEGNRVMNLTAIREEGEVARLHMADCAALLDAPGAGFAGHSLVDVGTGAGFPGLVVKILEPGVELTLVDAQEKRLNWLEGTAGRLGLEGIAFVHGRGEELGRSERWRERFDFAAARAVARLGTLCELCLPFVRPGGRFFAMKGPEGAVELEEAQKAIAALGGEAEPLWRYDIPGAARSVAVVRKTASTPPQFPRKWAKMRQRPL